MTEILFEAFVSQPAAIIPNVNTEFYLFKIQLANRKKSGKRNVTNACH